MISIIYNGEAHTLTNTHLPDVIAEITDLDTAVCAVALNQNFVPRSEYANVTLKNDDQLELLTPMQGG